jgi:sugar transferase (PEP-CTERM/EpsH1 system associated)
MNEPLKILFLAPYVPSAIRVRPFQLVRELSGLGHRITVVALDDGFADSASLQTLKDACEAVHVVSHPRWQGALQAVGALATPTPLWSAYCRSPRMARLVRESVRVTSFDIAHVEHLRAAHLVPELGPLPRVFDAVDCITALQRQMMARAETPLRRLLAWEEWFKLRRFEPQAYRPFDHLTVTSDYDASELGGLSRDLPPLSVIPNGVDLAYFQPTTEPSRPDVLVFSGKMSYRANEDAALFLAREIFPRVVARRPNAQLWIVGSSPTPEVQALAAGNVRVTGFVEDLRPFLAQAAVAVCPMRIGVGIQNKALEAMAMGRPVVCSPIAARALGGAEKTGAVRVAEDAGAFADECVALLERPEAAFQAGCAARRYVETRHPWRGAAERFVGLYRGVLSEKNRAA